MKATGQNSDLITVAHQNGFLSDIMSRLANLVSAIDVVYMKLDKKAMIKHSFLAKLTSKSLDFND